MKQKILVWWFENSDSFYESFLPLIEEYVNCHRLDIKRFKDIQEAIKEVGNPELIILDASCIGCGLGYMKSPTVRVLGKFIEKHTSAIIGIYSAAAEWASELIDFIKERFKDDVVVEPISFCFGIAEGVKEFFERHSISYD